MTALTNEVKDMLEDLFEMGGGYVLDFSNGSFQDFVETSIGFDPYDRYQGSKAQILRQIWRFEPAPVAARLNRDLIARWKLGSLRSGRNPTAYQQHIIGIMDPLFAETGGGEADPEALAFLDQPLGDIDFESLRGTLSAADVVGARLVEIEAALSVEAPLAVIFLAGSTLEGLLLEIAFASSEEYTSCATAPRRAGRVKPLDDWTLSELISVSHAVGVLGADVARHSDQVRNFRNYIHPRQQLREGFRPRIETARIAQHVLIAAIKDIERARA